ncbi:MAG: c-type cytochrome [Bacteroidales bacterium]
MRTTIVIAGFLSLGALATVSLVAQQSPYPPAKPQAMAPAGSVARGAQLVLLGGCDDCHTPKLQGGVPDMSRRLSGHPANGPLPPEVAGGISTNMMLTAWRGPWGLSLTANITQDPETGIGKWTLADFKKTIRTGVDPTGYVLKPPMPIPTLQNLPDADLDAIFKFLKTVKPVKNAVGRK